MLPHCVILGNSFSKYQHRWEGLGLSHRQGRPETMLRLLREGAERPAFLPTEAKHDIGWLSALRDGAAGRVLEARVEQEASFPAASAFNDTSLHLFHPSSQ
jgi:hypothetical protein